MLLSYGHGPENIFFMLWGQPVEQRLLTLTQVDSALLFNPCRTSGIRCSLHYSSLAPRLSSTTDGFSLVASWQRGNVRRRLSICMNIYNVGPLKVRRYRKCSDTDTLWCMTSCAQKSCSFRLAFRPYIRGRRLRTFSIIP